MIDPAGQCVSPELRLVIVGPGGGGGGGGGGPVYDGSGTENSAKLSELLPCTTSFTY